MEYSATPEYYDRGIPAPGYHPGPVNYQSPVNYQNPINYDKHEYRPEYTETENYGGAANYSAGAINRGVGLYGGADSYEGVENYRGGQNPPNLGGNYPNNTTARREAYLKRKRDRFENTKQSFEDWDFDRKWRSFCIMPRTWWRASPPSHSAQLQHPVDIVVLTYTHGRTCQNTYYCSLESKRLQKNHLTNGAVDIVYNFMIGGNGQVFEGRGWHSSPRLNHRLQRFSRNSLHIGIMGNLRNVVPSETMLEAAHDLIKFGVKKQFIAPKFLEYSTKIWVPPRNASESEVLKIVGEF